MRRIVLILALLGCMVVADTADAHFCAHRVQLKPRQAGSVTVGLASEEKPIVEFVLHLPETFQLKAVPPPPPRWTAVTEGRDIRFAGGPLRPLDCMYVTIGGLVVERGIVVIPMTVKADDGTTREYTSVVNGDQYAAQVVIVGDAPPSTADPAVKFDVDDAGSDAGDRVRRVVVVAVIAAVAGVAWRYRSKRARRGQLDAPEP